MNRKWNEVWSELKRFRLNIRLLVVPWLVVGFLTASYSPAQAVKLTLLSFAKVQTDPNGVWQGIVEGDITGKLTTQLLEAQPSTADPNVLDVVFDWIINADNPSRSLIARLTGTLNQTTGEAVMSGVVTTGYLKGSQVYEKGQLVDPNVGGFQGNIRITPIHLTFMKELAVPGEFGVWEGTVEGDISGTLRTELLEAQQLGALLLVRFAWIVEADIPTFSFTAHLTGTLNLNTGAAVMNGVIVEGFLKGAEVYEEGQLVNPDEQVLGFEGTIDIGLGT